MSVWDGIRSLDYLASRFVENGWSIKKMHREIMLSATYAEGARESAAAVNADPQNRLLSHASRRRLDAESLRDEILSASVADFRAFADALAELTACGPVVVLGSEEAIQAANARRPGFLRVAEVV